MSLLEVPEKALPTDTISLTDYNTIAANINELIGRSAQNQLNNGGFEVWQRGAGPFTADLAYTADRWQLDLAGSSTCSVSRSVSVSADPAGLYCLEAAYTHNANSEIKQRIEAQHLRDKYLALSIRLRSSVSTTVTFGFRWDGTGVPGYFTTIALTANTWATAQAISSAVPVAGDATYVEVYVVLGVSQTLRMDNAMLVIGPVATEYVPLTPKDDLERCQRYYEVHGGVNAVMHMGGYNGAGAGSYHYVSFAVPKGGTPTVTKNGTWAVTNCGQPAITSAYPAGYSVGITVTALGAYIVTTNGTDDTITAEWNP